MKELGLRSKLLLLVGGLITLTVFLYSFFQNQEFKKT